MELHTAVQVFAIIHLGVVGVSHIVAHRAWAEFFVLLRSKGSTGVFATAYLSLGFGSIVAAFHWVWTGIPLVLTLLGWAQVIKGALYLCVPSFGMKQLERVTLERSKMFIVPGVILVALAGLFLFHVVSAWP